MRVEVNGSRGSETARRRAITRAVEREDAQRSLFGGDELPGSKAIDFYAHDVG